MAKASTMKLKDRLAEADAPAAKPHNVVSMDSGVNTTKGHVAAARIGKKATVGHFSEAMSRKLNSLAAAEGRTLQYCMGEAWDLWLQSRGEQPFGER
jgi:hypothetical protein